MAIFQKYLLNLYIGSSFIKKKEIIRTLLHFKETKRNPLRIPFAMHSFQMVHFAPTFSITYNSYKINKIN